MYIKKNFNFNTEHARDLPKALWLRDDSRSIWLQRSRHSAHHSGLRCKTLGVTPRYSTTQHDNPETRGK